MDKITQLLRSDGKGRWWIWLYCDACEGRGDGSAHGVDGDCSFCNGQGFISARVLPDPAGKGWLLLHTEGGE